MKAVRFLIFLSILFVVLIQSMCIGTNEYPSNGILKWKGQNWNLTSGKSDPGNNYWNNTGAWIDSQDRVHLTVIKDQGRWKCTELESQNEYLYGTFTWTIASPVYTFDKNSVMGLFTYFDDSQELDVEVSRWGTTDGSNLWYTVQPSEINGNNKGYLISPDIKGTNTIYRIDWKPTYIRFTSMQENGEIIADYNYTNISGIPYQPERAIMNLWLLAPPSNGKNIELIISDFKVT